LILVDGRMKKTENVLVRLTEVEDSSEAAALSPGRLILSKNKRHVQMPLESQSYEVLKNAIKV